MQVKVRILESGDLLRPDMGAKVTFLDSTGDAASLATATPAHPLPRVPARALVAGDGSSRRAWVIDGETVHPVRVETGGETEGFVEVRSGLSGGERVVLDPPSRLEEGTRVRVRA